MCTLERRRQRIIKHQTSIGAGTSGASPEVLLEGAVWAASVNEAEAAAAVASAVALSNGETTGTEDPWDSACLRLLLEAASLAASRN